METNLATDNKYFRFQVFQGEKVENGFIRKEKSVGMAYLKQGQSIYTLRLWTFINERFYLIHNQNDPTKYLVMTREVNKNLTSKGKYFWNIVGNGIVDSRAGVLKINFDLFEKPVFMNILPESSAYSISLQAPEEVIDEAA